ncbi:TPA: replication initiator protein [Escherichia coli]|nr:replication initiator protein [Escherichia coli]
MGSCAAPSAKGDDKFITTDYLQQCLHFICQAASSPGDVAFSFITPVNRNHR